MGQRERCVKKDVKVKGGFKECMPGVLHNDASWLRNWVSRARALR